MVQRLSDASNPQNPGLRASYQQRAPSPILSQTVIRNSSVSRLSGQGDDVKVECVDRLTGERFIKLLYSDGTGIKMIKNSRGDPIPVTSELLGRLTSVGVNQGPAQSVA